MKVVNLWSLVDMSIREFRFEFGIVSLVHMVLGSTLLDVQLLEVLA